MDEGVIVRAASGLPKIVKRTRGSWTATKEDIFLLELGITCNATAAARAVGMSIRSAYDRRARDPGFRKAWSVAVSEGYERLELTMLERAIGGQRKPVFFGGARIASVRDYPDRMAITLLTQHRATAKVAPVELDEEAVAEARAKLLKRLTLIRFHNTARAEAQE